METDKLVFPNCMYFCLITGIVGQQNISNNLARVVKSRGLHIL